MKKSTLISFLAVFLLIPATLFFGTKNYYLTGTLVILEAMLPFFLRFEANRAQARQIVLIALMAALAAISRTVFAFLPHFKPITAIVMLSGIAFGAQAGFLTGALAAFASNFAFGQGLWTPWQMFAYGFGGFLAGLFFHDRHFLQKKFAPLGLAIFGFCAILLFVGPLLDCSSLFLFGGKLTWTYVISVFSVGLWANLLHGISCAVTLMLLGRPLLQKLLRLRKKYGI